ncbi:MAG: PAS domain S-box protein [Burkholderiaceae bacterium]|nr:PAS domain S-box protein [Burkholderiaceae bacterium]
MRSDPALQTLNTTRRLIWLLLVPVLLLLLVLTALQYRERVADAEQAIARQLDERAQELAALAQPARAHVHDMRVLMESVWNEPPDAGPGLARALQPRQITGVADGYSLDGASPQQQARHGQIWWAEPGGGAFPEAWQRRAQAFTDHVRRVHAREPGFVASWFAGMDVNTSFGYPFVSTASILQSLELPSLQAIAALRVQAAQRTRARLAGGPADAARQGRWGPPYVSQLDGELVVSHMAEVVVEGQMLGEVSLDLRIAELQRRMDGWRPAAGRGWIVDDQRHVLADSSLPLRPSLRDGGRAVADTHVKSALASRLPEGLAMADLALALERPGRPLHAGGWVLAAAQRPGSPWTVVHAQTEASLRQAVLPSLLPNALIALMLLAMFVAGQWLLSRNFVNPAMQVLAYLRALTEQRDAPAPQLGRRWQLWVDAVTQTFRTQHELQRRERQREAFKSAIVDKALAAIVATDEQGFIREFNPAAEAMFGCSHEAALGRSVAEVIIPPRFRGPHEAGMRRMREGGAARVLGKRMELQALRADGSEFPVEMVLWRTEVDGESHYTASITDLSERRAAAQEIERQREALRQSEKLSAMGSLLAGVAHELNNPLAIVMGRANLLEEKCEDQPALRSDAMRIREAAERCGRIVRTFLNMARSRPAQRGPMCLNTAARAAADLLAYSYRSHGIELQLRLQEPLPEVLADADQIGQVVLNLLVNAQQALAAGSGESRRVSVSTGVDDRGGAVWLRVSDNGPGIAAAVRAQLFQPFFTTKPEGLGTGLGLVVSRSLAREHGGELSLEPASPDGGTRFLLSLPLGGSLGSVPLPTQPGELEFQSQGQILVVDDEAEIAELMRAMLESAGYEVACAESGAVALELTDAARFDAIVCDLRMPDMDGAALWRAVRARQPALARRMLFVTGDTLSAGASQFLQSSGCASLDKPFTKADLLSQVAALMAGPGDGAIR